MKNVLALTSILLAACGSEPDDDQPLRGTSFVLVHGAWQGAWAWNDVAPALRQRGATVTAVELPGHGEDTTPPAQATLDAYVAKVTAVVDGAGPKVVLVGHSMGGMVITQVAEQRPDRIAHLVYVAAFVPRDGETLLGISQTDKDSLAGAKLQVDTSALLASLPRESLGEIFCADCARPKLDELLARYRHEPIPAFNAPVRVTAASWGRVPKHYVFASQDRAVSPTLQKTMTAGVAWTSTTTLDTSHSPFLSVPGKVVDVLTTIGR